jgi:hypothetical protein
VRKSLPVLMLIAVSLIYASMIAKTRANPSATIETTDAYGVTRTMFNLGEKIHIKAHSDSTPYTVSLYDPGYNLIHSWPASSPDFDSGELDDATNIVGEWHVWADNKIAPPVEFWMSVSSYHVIQEAATFGVLGIVAACFAALGIKAVRVKRKP